MMRFETNIMTFQHFELHQITARLNPRMKSQVHATTWCFHTQNSYITSTATWLP